MDIDGEYLDSDCEELEEQFQNLENENYIDEINTYNHEDQPLVLEALKSIGFPFLNDHFIKEEIDYQAFQNLNSTFICSLLKDFSVGLAVKFEIRYQDWKSKTSEVINDSTSLKPGIITEILQSTEEGRNFLKSADPDKKFDKKTEKCLTSLICSYFFAQKRRLPINDLKFLAEDIQRLYPKENSSIYVQVSEKSTSGTLFDKYNNKLRMLVKSDLMPTSNRKRKLKESPKSVKKSKTFSQTEIDSNEFVKFSSADIDHSLLASHWRKSSQIRHDFLKQNIDKKITSMYRALLRPDGYQLISIDFDNLFPNRNFNQMWINNANKLKMFLLDNVQQSQLSIQINAIDDMSSNRSVATVLLGLHNVLFGDKAPSEKGKKSYKPTVYDAFKFLLLIVNDESSMELELNGWIEDMALKSLKPQCIIIGFGSGINNLHNKFCIAFEDVRYKFEGENSLLLALETLLKVYHVLDLNYPLINASVYTFLSSKYLTIKSGNKADSSKVIRLMSALN